MHQKDQQLLLKLAQDTLAAHFQDRDPDTSNCAHLTQLKGCFVTILKDNKLRGCIGFIKPIMPLFEQVIAATRAAAFEDPRFDPVREEEHKDLRIEISILTRPELVKATNSQEFLDAITIGKDGIIVSHNGSSGLLLPQVAAEHNWSSQEFLESTCEKANLDADCWKRRDTKVYRFRADVFST